MSPLPLPLRFWGTAWGAPNLSGCCCDCPHVGQGSCCDCPCMEHLGNRLCLAAFLSPEVGAGLKQAVIFLSWQVTSTFKTRFLQTKNVFWILAYKFIYFFLFLTVCRFRNLQGAFSYWCFTPLWKGNCYLGAKTEMILGLGSTNLLLCALWLKAATRGLGRRWLFCECLFLACRHTCTWSKSAAVLAFRLGRAVRKKDVMGFETKVDVQLQTFFFSTTSYFHLH